MDQPVDDIVIEPRLQRIFDDFLSRELQVFATPDEKAQSRLCLTLKSWHLAFIRIVAVGQRTDEWGNDAVHEIPALIVFNAQKPEGSRLRAFSEVLRNRLAREEIEPIMVHGIGLGPAKLVDWGTGTRVKVYGTLIEALKVFYDLVGRGNFTLETLWRKRDRQLGSGWMTSVASQVSGEIQ